MNINSEKTVWINVESDRYFIIPDDKQIAEGSFELKTVDRRERTVQEVDVSLYEVDEEEAHQWLEEQVKAQMNRAKEAVKHAFDERKKESEVELNPSAAVTEPAMAGNVASPALTMVTTEEGTFDSFDSFVESNRSATASTSTAPVMTDSGMGLDEGVQEAVSILNKAVTEIQLTAARAVADLQELKEKMAAKATA